MASQRSSTKTKSKARAAEFLQKPRDVISPRVQKVGPEHFGIVAVERTFQSRTVDDVVLWAKNAAAPDRRRLASANRSGLRRRSAAEKPGNKSLALSRLANA